MLTSDTAGPTC